MLDWASLIGAPAEGKTGENLTEVAQPGPKCPSLSQQKGPVSHPDWDRINPVTARDTDDLERSVPTVPVKKQGRGKREEKSGGAAAQPQDFRAEVSDGFSTTHPAHPEAVLLVMAWSRLKQYPSDERSALLLNLETMSPAEQVRHWHGVCVNDGLKPWHVLCLPARLSGSDCTLCRHLTTRFEAIGEGRRCYHWACDLGYLILESGRGTERIWIAPEECESFDRWYPSDQR